MTQAQLKYIQSLSRQKYRKAHNAYLVEGNKNAQEWLKSTQNIQMIAALPEWISENNALLNAHSESLLLPVNEKILNKITALKNPQSVLLVIEMPVQSTFQTKHLKDWSLYLEEIKDPGNMGTIIRIADWFGIQNIFYSDNCVEIYNPKVVQATMGSLLRIQLHHYSPDKLIDAVIRPDYPLYATTLDGENIFQKRENQRQPGVLALGKEATGLSDFLIQKATYKLKIEGKGNAESLNVAVAAGIFCAWLT